MSAAHFRAGDQVLLAGGQTFQGGIWLRGNTQGTPSQPITFRSYGAGRAVIQSDSAFGFYAHNSAGIALRNLAFVGRGRLSNRNSGVIFYLDSANTQLRYLRLDSLEVSGYRNSGLNIGSWNGLSGYSDVRITNCRLHDNGEAGLSSYAFYPAQGLAHHDWYVGNCQAYDNAGRADVTTTHTGNGIVLSGIDNALIEYCTAYHNGWLNANPAGGPVGIWGWACNALVVQHCESHHNLSGTTKDGGGFDLDGGCTNSILQYNYSHDNQGPGYLLAQFPGAPAMHDLTVRYNISTDDARGYDQGAIELWSSGANGGIVRAQIYNNTVSLSAPADGSTPRAFFVASAGISDVAMRNNVLQTAAGLPVVTTLTGSGLRLEGNCYWSSGAPLQLNWNGTTYNRLTDLRTATGQETLGSGSTLRTTGLCADPGLPISTTGSTGNQPAAVSVAATLVGAGLNLRREFSLDPGPRDFFGNPTPTITAPANIGATEGGSGAPLPTRAATSATSWCQVYPTVTHSELHVVASQTAAPTASIQLFDLLGRACRSWQPSAAELTAGHLTLPVAGLPAGRYVLCVRSGELLLRTALLVD